MENSNPAILVNNDIAIHKKEKLLAKQFFPSYLLGVKYLINGIYKIHPETSYRLTTKLLSVAVKKRLSKNAKVFYEKGMKQEIIVDGATFRTYTYGSGPLILMLHGWCSNGARWRVYVDKLVSSGYKVMVVDAPGHGTAPGWFLSVFLYAKGIKAILKSEPKWHTVITHSIAGLTAIAAIRNSKKKYHPKKFIMMNTFANATSILEKFSRCLGISEKVMEGAKVRISNRIELPLKEFSINTLYNTMNLDGLLIYDTKDRVVPSCEAKFLVQHVKPLRVFETEGLGHNLKSSTVVNEVLDFVNHQEKIVSSDIHDDINYYAERSEIIC